MARYIYNKSPAARERNHNLSWDDLLAQFLAAKRRQGRTDKHIYDLRLSLSKFAAWMQGKNIMPSEVNKQAVNLYLDAYKAQGVKDISVQHQAVKIMSLYTWAYVEEIYETDKLATFTKPRISDKIKHNPVTLDEIGLVVNQIKRDWSPDFAPASRFRSEEARSFFALRDICMTLWLPETGCRIGETCKVLMCDIDLDARTAKLRTTKNGDDRIAFFTTEYRDGPLADWLAIRKKLHTISNTLFVTETGLPLSPGTWGRQWDKYRQHAGIERRIRRHDLRHFSSTAHDRVDKELSKKIIGHHTDAAHAIYSHRELDELRAAHDEANPIGPLLAPAPAAPVTAQPRPRTRRVYAK